MLIQFICNILFDRIRKIFYNNKYLKQMSWIGIFGYTIFNCRDPDGVLNIFFFFCCEGIIYKSWYFSLCVHFGLAAGTLNIFDYVRLKYWMYLYLFTCNKNKFKHFILNIELLILWYINIWMHSVASFITSVSFFVIIHVFLFFVSITLHHYYFAIYTKTFSIISLS